MTTYVALLYSVVLGKGRRVNMGELRAMAERLGFGAPRTLVATGNLVFEAGDAAPAAIEARLEPAFEEAFGRHVDIIVRRAADWSRMAAANPFRAAAEADPRHVIVRVMRSPAGRETIRALEPYRTGEERVRASGGDLWIHFAHGVAGSRLASALVPARIGVGTSRNWNTVRRLAGMAGG